MQRKAYPPGAAVLLAVLLAGCSMGSGTDTATQDAKSGVSGSPSPTAEPGKYQSLPEPCGSVDHGSLDTLLPGVKDIKDERQRERAYEGTAKVTYDTNRLVGCSWSMSAQDGVRQLAVGFERVVSYDSTVSDDTRAEQVFLGKESDAGIAAPPGGTPDTTATGDAGTQQQGSLESTGGDSGESPDPDGTAPAGDQAPPDLEGRALDGLGDAAFVDDTYTSPSSDGGRRTVTVVFRTSNVVVTVQYEDRPAHPEDVPDSKEMQDSAQSLAHKLADSLAG